MKPPQIQLSHIKTVEDALEFLTNLSSEIESIQDSRERSKQAKKIMKSMRETAASYTMSRIIKPFGGKKKKSVVIPPEEGPRFFSMMTLDDGSNPNLTALRNYTTYLSEFFKEFKEPETEILPVEKIQELLEIAEEETKALTLINQWKSPLKIACIPKTHKNYNSLNHYEGNLITCCAPHKEHNEPEYILLHETGHSLQMAITKDNSKVPESFLPVFEVTFGTDVEEVKAADWPEIFADSFSIAVSYKTPLEKTNPFCQLFYDYSLAGLKTYFQLLIDYLLEKQPDMDGPVDMEWSQDAVEIMEKAMDEAASV